MSTQGEPLYFPPPDCPIDFEKLSAHLFSEEPTWKPARNRGHRPKIILYPPGHPQRKRAEQLISYGDQYWITGTPEQDRMEPELLQLKSLDDIILEREGHSAGEEGEEGMWDFLTPYMQPAMPLDPEPPEIYWPCMFQFECLDNQCSCVYSSHGQVMVDWVTPDFQFGEANYILDF